MLEKERERLKQEVHTIEKEKQVVKCGVLLYDNIYKPVWYCWCSPVLSNA